MSAEAVASGVTPARVERGRAPMAGSEGRGGASAR
eukprot:CAMPEP_0181332704 /NCGR_PEP_ID=MMETSP1101-20121128/25256_1 /TAXON_ID=46948 /ORGANISM="Rhodomonas abbreviata, Strain Caron Lab Isolate" /LENGTH=34 /DNA_ID= /DNA_START= /DNA_END= /DNA_ORIENTATION=